MKELKRPEHLWVGINGKASGYHALKEAISIARWLHASVTAIAVTPLYEGDLGLTGVGSVRQNLFADIEASLSGAFEIADDLHYPVQIAAAGGDVCNQLLEKAADSHQTGWIVIGASPSFSALRWLAGTPLLSMVTRSTLPVLIIPEKTTLSGETIWLDLGRTHWSAESAAIHLDMWIEASLQITAWFGVDRLTIARPENFRDRHLLQHLLSERQEKRMVPDISENKTLVPIETVDFPYRDAHEGLRTMQKRPPALVLLPSPFRQTGNTGAPDIRHVGRGTSVLELFFRPSSRMEEMIRFPGKCRLSIAAWNMEKRLRSLPCPVLVLPSKI